MHIIFGHVSYWQVSILRLLKYFKFEVFYLYINAKTEIKKNKPPYEYNDNKFSFFEIHNPSKFENYDGLQIGYKTNDKNYIIYGIAGGIFYEDNIDECFTKKNKIELEVSELFNNLEKEDLGRTKHPQDKSGKSTVEGIYLNFKSGSYIRISCYDWSKEFEKKIGLML